ncbi:hypothetical protein [Terrarubrum flagellatum]|uniref:hypothetical protein n=1 Tax=Terrirubrum flagellatum TaxID=2895980 RepID=UPI0031451FEC
MPLDPATRKAFLTKYGNVRGPGYIGGKGALIVPSNNDFSVIPRNIVALTAGNVTFLPVDQDDASPLTIYLDAGRTMPFFVRRITAASGTLATVEDLDL